MKIFLGILFALILIPIPLVFGATVFFANSRFTEDGIQWCEEEKPRYHIIGEAKWLEHHRYSIESRICANLYYDPLWDYTGFDRVQKLIERSAYYAQLEIDESKKEAEKGKIDPNPVGDNRNQKIPSWVRNIFIWFGENKVTEDDVINAIRHLIKIGVIKI